MSRIGKLPVIVPAGVTVVLSGRTVQVKGPKGELKRDLNPVVKVVQEQNSLTVSVPRPENKDERALWGLTRALLQNMVKGVTDGFGKQLEINGVGMKATIQGKKLTLNVGFSHPVEFVIPDGVEIKVEKNVITLSGPDKELVGQIAANIRKIKKPEPYKGKGIKYIDEVILRKEGKVVKSG
ncbi:MAG: 50S ribosomal protein L6 [bacterium]